jgi:autotransporter passenger strand-loop-strand repeat protein
MSTMSVASGHTSRSLVISSGEDELVYGSALSSQIEAGGTQSVVSGGYAGAARVQAGGTEIVALGGLDTATIVSSAGEAYVAGASLAPTVSSAGALYVSAGGTVSRAVDRGSVTVSAGGMVVSTIVSSAAVDYVQGGIASLSIINTGGVEYVLSGGSSYNAVVKRGGVISVVDDGTASVTTVSAGGFAGIGSGGLGYGLSVQAGGAAMVSAGSAYFTTIAAGGTQSVDSAGVTSATTIAAGGVEIVGSGGTELSALISANGIALIMGGGSETGDEVVAGGRIVALPGADATGRVTVTGVLLLAPGSSARYASSITHGEIKDGGTADILSAGTATDLTVTGGANIATSVNIYAGGLLLSSEIDSGGMVYVSSGGREAATTVGSAGFLYVSAGTAYDTTISANASFNLIGGSASATIVEAGALAFVQTDGVASGTVVSGFLGVVSAGTAFETTVASGGRLYLSAGGDVAGLVDAGLAVISRATSASDVIIEGGTLVLSAGNQFGSGLAFSGAGGTLALHTMPPAATIGGFLPGDTIVLDTLAYDSATTLSVTNAGTLVIGGSIGLNIAGATSAGQFALEDIDGETGITTNSTACYVRGTRLLTPRGEVPIESLAMGDRVITNGPAGRRTARIIWVGYRHIDLTRHAWPGLCAPVRIRAGALGRGRPRRDLRVSPRHGLYLDGQLFEAIALVNGQSIYQERQARAVTYHHIELATHSLILAEGCLAETYLDTGNRWMFDAPAAPLVLHPVFAPATAAGCAPRVSDAATLAAMRARLTGFSRASAHDRRAPTRCCAPPPAR